MFVNARYLSRYVHSIGALYAIPATRRMGEKAFEEDYAEKKTSMKNFG